MAPTTAEARSDLSAGLDETEVVGINPVAGVRVGGDADLDGSVSHRDAGDAHLGPTADRLVDGVVQFAGAEVLGVKVRAVLSAAALDPGRERVGAVRQRDVLRGARGVG